MFWAHTHFIELISFVRERQVSTVANFFYQYITSTGMVNMALININMKLNFLVSIH